MAFTNVFYQNAEVYAVSFPPPAVAYLVKSVEAAEASVMEELVQKALDEVAALNVLIAAAYPQQPELLLTLNDADLAGAGDGHTFICTLFFVPADNNGIAAIISSGPMLPEIFRFRFGIAGESEEFGEQVTDAITRAIGDFDMPAIFQFTRGGAKGTRFMFGVGGIPELGEQ